MTETAAKTVVQAFVSRSLDYCNSLLFGVAGNLIIMNQFDVSVK